VILRTDTDASFIECVAGGLRNAYDLEFNREGELFTFDSDMEWDIGLPWYRPTRINHIIAGGEYGWRSGWAKWPEYFYDSVPATLNIGGGSPTGIICYDHYLYPQIFQNTLFACDWSRGRILNIRLQPAGASYTATSEVFLSGRPLNVTDIDVGPDGWLYYCTGGRDTEGGIYRITWTGEVPEDFKPSGDGILAALRQPQPNSAWGHQKVAAVKASLGDQWGPQLIEAARNKDNPPPIRNRALHLMELFGPFPDSELLLELSQDPSATLRAKAVYLLALHVDPDTTDRLIQMLHDVDPIVRRRACEGVVRCGLDVPVDILLPMLADPDRQVAWAACCVLQQISRDQWKRQVLTARDHRAFLMGALALMKSNPNREEAVEVLKRASTMLNEPVSDTDFVDLLRLIQVAFLQGKVGPNDVPALRKQIADEFPSRHNQMNRELIRLLAFFKEPSANARILAQIDADIPMEEKLQPAFHAQYLPNWNTDQKLRLIAFYEEARRSKGGQSLGGYVEYAARDFAATLNAAERTQVLNLAKQWPTTALGVLESLARTPSDDNTSRLISLDRELSGTEGDAIKRLKVGIVATLGVRPDELGMRYLRYIYEHEPERRSVIAMALAQSPDGENWPALVRSLPVLEGAAAMEVLSSLTKTSRVPEDPEPIRQVILLGLRLKENGAVHAIKLLEKWTSQQPSEPEDEWSDALAKWQTWFRTTYPNSPDPILPEATGSRWGMEELLEYLTSVEGSQGDVSHGARVFEKALCSNCHLFAGRGEGLGPDLTTVGQRFQKKEILESVLFPSHVVSDQYSSSTVVTSQGKTYTGIVVPRGSTTIVLLSTGEKVNVATEELAQIVPSKASTMPEGLFDNLTREEIGDLFAFLLQSQVETARRVPGDAMSSERLR
jgi:putative heme-binding domain-containing protein